MQTKEGIISQSLAAPTDLLDHFSSHALVAATSLTSLSSPPAPFCCIHPPSAAPLAKCVYIVFSVSVNDEHSSLVKKTKAEINIWRCRQRMPGFFRLKRPLPSVTPNPVGPPSWGGTLLMKGGGYKKFFSKKSV